MSESGGHRYLERHDISGPMLLIDIEAESKGILQAVGSTSGGHTAKTLVKEGPLRVVILGLKSGAEVREHEAGGPSSIQALSGRVAVESGGNRETLDGGRMILFGASVPHALRAETDAVVLLTIAWPQT